tara:strand:- start:3205 stop:3429 length:225 start_codon:yes stop_codon:yes gene_type:complete
MKYITELNLTDFNFWGGAKDHEFTYTELKELEYILEDIYHKEPPTETQINDVFWFEEKFLCKCIGLDLEEYENR